MKRHHLSGQGLIEYGFIMLLVAVVLIAALELFAGNVASTYQLISGAFS